MDEQTILEVRGLTKAFPIQKGFFGKGRDWLQAVNHVSFSIRKGETLALVGESGCGKSTTRKLIVRAIEADSGEVIYNNQNILKISSQSMRGLRKKIQVVFQDPYASLDPKWRIGRIISEPLRTHRIGEKKEQFKRTQDLMALVGISPDYYNRYPYELSGGQRQRVGIARALATEPEIIIADEPVSALDVSIQAQILNMFKRLQRTLGLTYIFISHDLSIVHFISDRVAVMYLGEIIELAATPELFGNPKHPYTKALLESIPLPDPSEKLNLKMIQGEVPSPIHPPSGCSFHPRCPFVREECKSQKPLEKCLEKDHWVKCHLFD